MLEEAPPRGFGERLLALGRFLRLAPLTPAELSRLARVSRERAWPAGARLAAVGQVVRAVQFMVAGRVALSHGGTDFLTLEAPETVGLLPLAGAIPFNFEVRALEPIQSVEVDADILAELLEDDFDLFARALRAGAEAVLRRGLSAPTPAGPPAEAATPAARGLLGPAERLLALRNTELFRRCPVDGLSSLAKQLEEVRVASGERLVVEPGALVVAVEGQASSDQAGAPALGAGAVAGLVEGLAEQRRGFELRVTAPLLVLRGTVSALLDVLEDHQAMGRRLVAELLRMLVGG
jgi:CRP-like cAMP-binding protein